MHLFRLTSLVALSSLSIPLFSSTVTAEAAVPGTSKSSKHQYDSHATTGDLVCRPFGECEPCPEDELHRPYCHPYGNRRLMHCIPHALLDGDPYADPSEIASEAVESDHHPTHHNSTSSQQDGEIGAGNAPYVIGNSGGKNDWSSKGGEIPAWESCGKVVIIERAEYGEFVTTNALFLIVSLFILLLRANKLAAVQYRALAAKIGIGGSVV